MGNEKSRKTDILKKGIRVIRNSGMPIGICDHTFKVGTDNKAVCVSEYLVVPI